jgi:galactokinase
VQLRDLHQRQFGSAPAAIARAPGRVNLIGEHTDYNDGFVFPIAIERDTLAAVSPRPDGQVRLYSAAMRQADTFQVSDHQPTSGRTWTNYVRGVVAELHLAGLFSRGADITITSTVPVGAGLSSSAALELSTATALLALAGAELPIATLAKLCQRVEHVYAGVNCGIMDQTISASGVSGHALLLDCRSLATEAVPLPAGYRIGVADSGVEHGLVASKYNTRRAQCEEGVRLLQAALPGIVALRDVSSQQLAAHGALLPDLIYRRCRHVVTENERVLASVAALKEGDVAALGRYMYDSHASLRDDYQVSVPELDLLVEAAAEVDGVAGSRMTGGGFGGCTVTLLQDRAGPRWERRVRQRFKEAFGRTPTTFVTAAAQGAEVLSI